MSAEMTATKMLQQNRDFWNDYSADLLKRWVELNLPFEDLAELFDSSDIILPDLPTRDAK